MVPDALPNRPFTVVIIMCLAENSTSEWLGSICQVLTPVPAACSCTVLMIHSLVNTSFRNSSDPRTNQGSRAVEVMVFQGLQRVCAGKYNFTGSWPPDAGRWYRPGSDRGRAPAGT